MQQIILLEFSNGSPRINYVPNDIRPLNVTLKVVLLNIEVPLNIIQYCDKEMD